MKRHTIDRLPIGVERMLTVVKEDSFRDKVVQHYTDPAHGDQYNAMMSELLIELPDCRMLGLADACDRYIRAWESGGGNQAMAQCVKDACTTDYPRVLAFQLYRSLYRNGVDKSEAYYLVESIYEDALLTATNAA